MHRKQKKKKAGDSTQIQGWLSGHSPLPPAVSSRRYSPRDWG
jgi:hypothetical protein